MVKLIVMCGLPASGKSTLAKELSQKYNAVILSSDSIREELYGDENIQGDSTKVFEVLHQRAKKQLTEGVNVIYDATNINRKRRVYTIKTELQADEYTCYYINKTLGECFHNDTNRERKVGWTVLDRMYKTLQIPIKGEGWDELHIVNDHEPLHTYKKSLFEHIVVSGYDHFELFDDLSIVVDEFKDVFNLPHDSKYHTFSVSRHIYYTYKYVFDNYKGNRRIEMLVAALFHDIGKAYCKSFYNRKGEETRTANFIGHEFVSAQIAMNSLYHLGYNNDFITYVSTLVQLHMIPHELTDKKVKKLKELLIEEQYEDLMFLNEADLQAH